MTLSRRLLFILSSFLLSILILAFVTFVLESVSAAALYIMDREEFHEGKRQHWLFSSDSVPDSVYRRDNRGRTLRRDPIPFDPYTVWRFSQGNVFWGLAVGSGGYIKNDIGTDVTYRGEADWHIFIVGGSSVAGAGATENANTIAPNLERILSRRTGRDVNVVNAGVGGWWSRQEVTWFVNYLLPNHKADDVIFLDGYNDSWRSVASAVLEKNRPQEISYPYLIDPNTRRKARNLLALESGTLSTRDALRLLSQSILRSRLFDVDAWFTSRLFLARGEGAEARQIAGAVTVGDAELAEMQSCPFEGELDLTAYESAMRTAAGAASAHQVNLHYVLQPSITFKETLTGPEKSTLYARHRYTYDNGWRDYGAAEGTCFFAMQQTFFQRAGAVSSRLNEELGGQFVRFLDLSALFSSSREDVFYDYAHYTDFGNKKIALALSKILLDEWTVGQPAN